MSITTKARTSLFPNGRPSAVTESLLRVRARTDPDRELPDFLIIGAQRCGTSSFYKYLEDHPLIVPSLRKEVRYFERNYARGEGWYRAHFPSKWHRKWISRRHGREPVSFEASPAYLLHPLAPPRAGQLLPETRIVAMLRNPVDRALSHYRHSVRHGWETPSFEEALEAELNVSPTTQSAWSATPPITAATTFGSPTPSAGTTPRSWSDGSPCSRGTASWCSAAKTSSTIRLRRTAGSWSSSACPPGPQPDSPTHSYGGATRPAAHDMSPDVRRQLAARFAPSNRRLEQLTGRSFGWDS